MFCKFCGVTNPDEVNFCGNCGKQVTKTPQPYSPKKRRAGIKIIIVLLFLLTLATYLSYLIFEPVPFEHEDRPRSLKEKIESIKKDSEKERTIDFYLKVTPEEIDGYLNEELLKKSDTGFRAIHTRLLKEEIEVALSTDFLRIPSMFKIGIRPEKSEGGVILSTSSMRVGHVPIPHFLYTSIYQRYPWLNIGYLLKLSGVKLKEIRIEKDSISFRGAWSI